ncbi:MAG TPA: hypothetical protein VMX13_03330 [Sedimentisphaerales bacterium]|nr:hypothetical protein [Sedimentisphaerales bacterium]
MSMKSGKSTALERLFVLLGLGLVLFGGRPPASGVIWHPAGEPDLATWTDRPDSNVVGRWSSNATFVVVAPNWIITTRHQNTFPSTVNIDGISYACHYKPEWTGGPSETADIQLVRLTTTDGDNPELVHYTGPYTGTDEVTQEIVLGGYGDGRSAVLETAGTTYGYDWDNSANTTLRFGTNRIKDAGAAGTAGSLTSDIITADFDGLNEGQSTIYESTVADHDSGGGWFIYDGTEWKLAGLSRAVGVHYEAGHEGDPAYILYEAWFRNRENPLIKEPDYLDGVRVSSYVAWILQTINVEGDLTGDDWVDFADFAALAEYWRSDQCAEENDWCGGADFVPPYGVVDYSDLDYLAERWLTGWQY